MAAQPAATTRSDEAELMWLDDADLMSVSEPSFTAANSGSTFARCIIPSLGLFAAVLFGHIILAATQLTPVAAKQSAAAAGAQATPASDSAKLSEAAPTSALLPRQDASTTHAAVNDEPPASAHNAEPTASPTASPTARDKSARSHRQHYDEGAHGSGANAADGSDEIPSAAVVTSQQPGMLRINSRPWAQVTLDGASQPLGHTPLFDVQIAPGAHTLRLDNPDFQVSKTIRVDVAPGETVTRVVSLQE